MTTKTLTGDALGGLTAGTLTEHGIHINGSVGIAGMGAPSRRKSLKDRLGEGQVGGASYRNAREVSVRLGVNDFDLLLQLEAAQDFGELPDDVRTLVLPELGTGGRYQVYVRPERFEYDVNQTATAVGYWLVDAAWVAEHPALFSVDQDEHVFGTGSATDGMATTPGSSFTFPATNAGTRAVRSGRATELRITAHGTVVDPYVKVADDPDRAGESVTWHLTMTSGQVLQTYPDLSTRIGSLQVNGKARSVADKFLHFPQLLVGTQQLEVGCASGTISGSFKTRSTR